MNHRPNRARRLLSVAVGAAAVMALASTTAQAASYPPAPPSGDRGISVDALTPNCVSDVPSILYTVSPVGFESTGPVTVTVRDLDGNVVKTVDNAPLKGSFTYPGVTVGADGQATDWPGWVQVDGVWVEDPTEARLRDGLDITFAIGSTTVSKTVGYSPALEECMSPTGSAVASQGPTAPAQGSLPATGNSGMSLTLAAAGIALLLGMAVTLWSKTSARRHTHSASV